MKSIPVLLYHHIKPYKDELTVRVDIFRRQLISLKESGWKFLSLQQFFSCLRKGIPSKSILITFDDGFVDFVVYAYPILYELKIPCVLFISPALLSETLFLSEKLPPHSEMKLNSMYYLTWDIIKELCKNNLVEIQSHTMSHINCKEEAIEVIEQELKESKSIIENNTGRECFAIAWPSGKYNSRAIEIAKKVGYKLFFGTFPLANVVQATSIGRFIVKDKSPLWLKIHCKIYSYTPLIYIYNFIKYKKIGEAGETSP